MSTDIDLVNKLNLDVAVFLLLFSFSMTKFVYSQNVDTVIIGNPILVHIEDSDGFISVCSVEKNLRYLEKGNLKKIHSLDSVFFVSHNFYEYLSPSESLINTDWKMMEWTTNNYKSVKYYRKDGKVSFYRVITSNLRFNDYENGFGLMALPLKKLKSDSLSVIAPLHE